MGLSGPVQRAPAIAPSDQHPTLAALHLLWRPLEVALVLMPGPRADLIASFKHLPHLSAKAAEVICPFGRTGQAPWQKRGRRSLSATLSRSRWAWLCWRQQNRPCDGTCRSTFTSSRTLRWARNHVWTDLPDPAFFAADVARTGPANVTRHGALAQTDGQGLLRRSDSALLPKRSDTFGDVVLEALAASLPVLRRGPIRCPSGSIRTRRASCWRWKPMPRANGSTWRGATRARRLMAGFTGTPRRIWPNRCRGALEGLLDDPAKVARLGRTARKEAVARLDGRNQGALPNPLYEQAVSRQPVVGW